MTTFSLNGRIGLNVSDLVSNADKARKSVSRVGEELDQVDGKKTKPTITVDDKATSEISSIDKRLDGLEGNDRTVVLNAESSRLKSEIKSAERQLQGLDAEQARPVLDLRNKAKAELDDVEKQLRKDIPDAASSGGKNASSNLSDSFADLKGAGGALLGGAVATAIVGGLQVGMERIQVREKITQQFGLIEADAKRFGSQAADIYASGWGEGTASVMSSLAQVNQRLVETGIIGAEETAKIGESATVLAEVFDMDVREVIEAVSKLMLNGLAPDAQTALDLVATAMQQGGNAADDLFESVDEYSVHFAAFGLSAEDMMALFVDGMANGMRDTDKLADAVKEMRIRAVDDTDLISGAYANLGLDADAYRLQILAGGPSAKKAFGEIIAALRSVEDPIERNRIAVELMGTPIEDLGITALDSFAAMGEGVEGFTGKVDEMNAAMTEAQPATERLWRSFKTEAGEAAETLAGLLEDVFDFAEWADKPLFGSDGTEQSIEALAAQQAGILSLSDAVVKAQDSIVGYVLRTDDLGKELISTRDATAKAAEANGDLSDSSKEITDEMIAAGKAADATAAIMSTYFDAIEAANETYGKSVEAVEAWAEGINSAAEAGGNSFGTFTSTASTSLTQWAASLNESSAAESAWKDNLVTVYDRAEAAVAGSGDQIVDSLSTMGVDGAGHVQALVDASDTDFNNMATSMAYSTAVGQRDVAAELDKLPGHMKLAMAMAEIERSRASIEAAIAARRDSREMGEDISAGIGLGISSSAYKIDNAMVAALDGANVAGRYYARIQSPSRLFADELGKPIPQGVAAGIDEDAYKIADAMTDSIENAEESAVKAAADLSESVLNEFREISKGADDVLSGLFDKIDNADRIEGLTESVSDAEQSLSDAQDNLNEVMADESSSLEDIKRAIEGKTDAQERLRDANMALTEATIDNVKGTEIQQAAWEESAIAAGLSIPQINALRDAYLEAERARQALAAGAAAAAQELATAQAGIAIEATQANQVNDRFTEAGAAGLIKATDYEDLGKLSGSPKAQIALMNTILARLEKLFAGSKGFAVGGRPAAGVPVMVGERGPEMVTFGPDALIHTAAASAAFAASSGRGVSGPVTNNMVMGGATGNTAGDVNVSVRIGQTELRDMIKDVVISYERQKELIR